MTARVRHDRQALIRDEVSLAQASSHGALRIALCYPNDYHIGMSNLGFHAVYRLFAAWPGVLCERVFLSDDDSSDERPRSLETGAELRGFDVIAFSVSFENDFLNLARMLHSAGLELRAEARGPRDPLIVVGGAAALLNPEPIAPFADVIAVGEGEALVPRLLEALLGASDPRRALDALREQDGFYVPSRHSVHHDAEGRIVAWDGPGRVKRQRVGVSAALPESAFLTPHTELSMKYLVEIARGCPCLCRFCFAGYNYLPPRHFPRSVIVERARVARAHTDKIGLVATAVCDHAEIESLVGDLTALDYEVSVSSLRFDDLTSDLVLRLSRTGAMGLTLAPECGSDRLRRTLNKRFTNAEILDRAAWIFENGFLNIKLYFMVGLPGEREEDVASIVSLTDAIRAEMARIARPRGRIGRIDVSVNPFVPKPGTPFQWRPLADPRDTARKLESLKRSIGRIPNVRAQCKGERSLVTQALLSLGDRRMADAIEASVMNGVSLSRAMRAIGLDAPALLARSRARDEILPWDLIDSGVGKEFLWRENERSSEARLTPRCPGSADCARCGVCRVESR